jgi:tRNA(fMet)-specific endonuclease VapC
MIYLPDTNAWSAYLAGRHPALTEKMRAAFRSGQLRLSVMVLAELAFGAEKARRTLGETRFAKRIEALRTQIEPEPLDRAFPGHYSRLRADLEAAGQKIGDRDTIIAAHALELDATLVTANHREFFRISGLQVENWQAA